jgi:hypothetical protein
MQQTLLCMLYLCNVLNVAAASGVVVVVVLKCIPGNANCGSVAGGGARNLVYHLAA